VFPTHAQACRSQILLPAQVPRANAFRLRSRRRIAPAEALIYSILASILILSHIFSRDCLIMSKNGGISKDAEIKAPWAYFDPEFNSRNVWQKYRYLAYAQFE
jgi:hypothetical protein